MFFNFGFKKVAETEKMGLVQEVFSSVASKYDLMNNFMSFGIQNLWKRDFVDLISLKDGGRYLDLACGSGDIAVRVLKKAEREGKKISLTLCDANEKILDIAKAKIKGCKADFVTSFAEDITFTGEFDGVFASFGVRNFTNLQKALSNIYISLKEGGSFYILEFFKDYSDAIYFHKIYEKYMLKWIPNLGRVVTGDYESYKYFGESIVNFITTKEFTLILQEEGFKLFSTTHSACKIASFLHFKK